MDVQTDGQTFETGFIRLTLLKSRPNKISKYVWTKLETEPAVASSLMDILFS